MSTSSLPLPGARGRRASEHSRLRERAARLARLPEIYGLIAVSGLLNLWGLAVNGWANEYYSAAVRSMAGSWHDFLYASMDKSGLMTVDKPPLALWVQALSVRIFGFHSLSILVPQALMGVAATVLMYDLTRRRFGRVAGSVAGLALATTPIIVAVSRHNNPDELLILCCVAAVWCALRAFDTGRARWLTLCGAAIGLGFETKMIVAFMIIPGIALAWVWCRWTPGAGVRGNLRMLGQLLGAGAVMLAVSAAWPLLVWLTPAADRPWVSGTADNSIWSLIFNYNGVGRVAGQTGGPSTSGGGGFGGANSLFGGSTGPFRLLNDALGNQAGWLLGFAVVSGAGILVLSRLRRSDPRTPWLLMLGGSLVCVGVVFSYASGIFHPYYVSFVAPWTAALVGAGVGQVLPRPFGVADSEHAMRVLAPLAIAGGVVTELIVLGTINGLPWAEPLIIAVGGASAVLLAIGLPHRVRTALVAAAVAALLAAPATWAAQTIGHATSGTFPAGGPASSTDGSLGGGAGGHGFGSFGGRGGFPGAPSGASASSGGFPGGGAPAARTGSASSSATSGQAAVQGLFQSGSSSTTGAGSSGASVAGPGSGFGGAMPGGAGGGMFGGGSQELDAAVTYAKAHGGGTIGVESQSTAASAILAGDTDVAGLGGFSGKESSVTVQWLAMEVRSGRLRWIADDGTDATTTTGTASGTTSAGTRGLAGAGFGGGDTRTGSATAFAVAEKVCRKVSLSSSTTSSTTGGAGGSSVTLYDCQGDAAKILSAAAGVK